MGERDILIRLASPDDAAAVTAILQASYPALMAEAYDPEFMASMLPVITRANPKLLASGSYYVADADGAPVACGGWTPEKPGTTKVEPGIGHLRHFGTRADWTGRGLGRLIYDRCEEQAREAGVSVLECFSSRNAEPFYASLGFRKIGEIDVTMSNGEAFPSIHMRREIADGVQ